LAPYVVNSQLAIAFGQWKENINVHYHYGIRFIKQYRRWQYVVCIEGTKVLLYFFLDLGLFTKILMIQQRRANLFKNSDWKSTSQSPQKTFIPFFSEFYNISTGFAKMFTRIMLNQPKVASLGNNKASTTTQLYDSDNFLQQKKKKHHHKPFSVEWKNLQISSIFNAEGKKTKRAFVHMPPKWHKHNKKNRNGQEGWQKLARYITRWK
jgi:hypothetical protein